MANVNALKIGTTTYNLDAYNADTVDNKHASDFATASHTHAFSAITNRGEAFLSWGGQNFSGSYGPIDAAMVGELGANRLAFTPAAATTVEYSRDSGATWTDYDLRVSDKVNLLNGNGTSIVIGKSTSSQIATNQCQARITIATGTGGIYTALNKFVIYLSTSGTGNNWCTIRGRLQSNYEAGTDTWTTFVSKQSVSGWSGYNVINTSSITTYGNNKTSQYGQIQFIFGCDTGSSGTYAGLTINKIFGFGGVGWVTPSTMAKNGLIYTYDYQKNVTFPAQLTATTFNGSLNGTATKATADASGNTITSYYARKNIATSGPSSANTSSAGSHNHTVTVNTYSATTSKLVTSTASKATADTARKIGNANVGTAIPADDITGWTTNTPTTVVMSVTGTTLQLGYTAGTPASLSYTARSIAPAVTSTDTITPYSFSNVTVATGSLDASGTGATIATGISAGTSTATTSNHDGHTHTLNSHTHTQN